MTTQFKSLLDFVLEAPRELVVLVHATCGQDVAIFSPPIGLEEVVRAASDHECP